MDRKGKELTLEIGRNAEVIINNQQSTPAKVTAGQKVEIDYETNFEIVTRIQIGARHQSSQPELIPLTELDADGSEDAPWLSSDGKTIYWTVATRSNP